LYGTSHIIPDALVRIGQSSHTAHDTKHVIVGSIYTHLGTVAATNGVVGQGQDQGGIVNAGEVAGAAGLVVLRLQGEAVHVDTNSGDVGVVLEGLHQVEVASITLREPVVAVELDLGSHHGVLAGQALHTGHAVPRLQDGAVPPVGVVKGLLSLPGAYGAVIAGHEGITLYHPHKLLARVVEVQADLVGAGGHGLTAGELQLLNQVLMGDLGEAATLISVQVDVVHVQGGRHDTRGGHAVTCGVAGTSGHVPAQVLDVVELQVDLYLVVLESNQGQSQTRVAVEPELEGDVQSVLRGAAERLIGGVRLTLGAVIVARLTANHQEVHQLRHIAHHVGVTGLLSRLLGELIPDLQPVTVVLVDLLSANLKLNGVDQVVAHPVQPAELRTGAVRRGQLHGGKGGLEVDAVNQITVTGNSAGYLLAEVGRAVEGLLNRLHGEVCVTAVYHLKKSNLRVSRQINILRTISHELH